MKIRLNVRFVNWLVENDVAWSPQQAALLKRLQELRPRQDGGVFIDLTREEGVILKHWAAWAIQRSAPGKGELGESRSLWNSAVATVRNVGELIADEDRRLDQGVGHVAGDKR